MSQNTVKHLDASPEQPITLYYCKAGISTGETIRITHGKEVFQTSGVTLFSCDASMHHDNATARAKRSGARCTLIITTGTVTFSSAA